MSKVIDAPAASSTATVDIDVNEGFAEFQAESRQARTSATVAEPPEVAPASEPAIPAGETPVTDKQEPLTDEQKSAMKRANNEKRWEKLLRERDDAKAELERLKAPKADPAASAPAAHKAVHPENPDDPKPKQDDFTDFDEYVDARSTWNARQVIKADRERQASEAAETKVRTQAEGFMGKIGTYAKDHEGFLGTAEEPGAFETIRDALEDGLQSVSSAIVEHDKPAELIAYLGTYPEAFQRILDHRANPAKALMALGAIIAAEFSEAPPPVAETTPRKPLPKPPAAITGRGHAPSGEAALDAAAEANDFSAAQKIFQARRDRERG